MSLKVKHFPILLLGWANTLQLQTIKTLDVVLFSCQTRRRMLRSISRGELVQALKSEFNFRFEFGLL